VTTRHLVDPELLAALDELPQFTFSAEILPTVRAGFAAMFGSQDLPDEPDIAAERREIAGPDGTILPVYVYRPRGHSDALRPAVLHIHGGGYIIGSALMSAQANVETARAMDAVVVSVDYRLAPETPHPGPVEDCFAALVWLHQQAGALGIDPARIAVMGESAGGGLAAALALLARDRGGPAICHQHLIYPMIDDRTCAREPHPHTGEFVWDRASNHFGWASLLGQEPGGPDISPYAAAARADDLAGLPPTFIYVGSLDLFVDEDMAYATRLLRAGVPCELHVHAGAYHGFERSIDAAITRRAKAQSDDALRRALRP
jgi:acetyl esterase/lipase